MGFGDSLISALFVMFIVFAVLLLLWGILVLFSRIIAVVEKITLKSIELQQTNTSARR